MLSVPPQPFQRLRALATPRLRKRAGLGLGALAILLVLAHLVLNSGAVATAIRATALEKLEARLGPVALGDRVEISWSGEARLGPLAIPAGQGEPPLVRVEEVRVRPSLGSLLSLHPELARVTLSGTTFEVDERGERIKAFRRRLPEKRRGASAGGSAHALPVVALEDARLVIDRRGDEPPVQLGPFGARVALKGEGEKRTVDARLYLPGGSARASGSLAPGNAKLVLSADDLPLAALVPQGVELPVAPRGGTLDGRIELTEDADRDFDARVDVRVRKLLAEGKRLADEPVGPLDAHYTGSVHFDRGNATLALDDSRLFIGADAVEIPFEASVDLHPELRFSVDARLGPIGLQQVVHALPEQLRPPSEVPKVDGALRAEVRASGPARRPDEWTVQVKLDTKDLKAKARVAPFPLREPFVYRPDDPSGVPRTIQVGERNPSFVPLSALPPIVPAAVITSEDGSFFHHEGFDFDEIRDSIATAAEGERLRGGSTLSQQLAKNLYLNRERTLARKVKEALVTLELEAALPKARMLEIYLNIIEWGPGVYGIGEAARYYFGVDARSLTPKQAVFLATIIPNPVKYSVYFRKGATSKNWDDHMAHLIEKLHERGELNDEQYQKALADPVVFRALSR